MIDAEQLRKALLEQLQALRDCGVTHLPRQDWKSLLATPAAEQSPPGSPQLLVETTSSRDHTLRDQTLRDQTVSRGPVNPGASTAAAANAPARSAVAGSRAATTASGFGGSSPAGQPDLSPYAAGIDAAQRPAALQVLQSEVAACRCCPELVRNRRQTVFGVGNPQARLCFLGEAPGQEEDAQGEPFVGAAGQLLDKIITACKLSREEVFILNTVKCRPPMNRTPSDLEIQNCWHFAHRQLEIIQPEFICCLGSVAAKSLLQTSKPIAQLRGTFHQYRSSRVLVTYHPAYLLRTPSAKRHVWDDMKLLMRELGVEL
ncbi:MAG: uracil-DNA glycosylase family protein [Planctomycetota bacterium]|jgi:DNA polymerase